MTTQHDPEIVAGRQLSLLRRWCGVPPLLLVGDGEDKDDSGADDDHDDDFEDF